MTLVIDSNGKFIDTTILARDKNRKCGKYFVLLSQLQQRHLPNQPLTVQAILLFTSVQTTSNNLPLTLAQFQTLVDIASQKYPSSKVLISSLLNRRDVADFHRSELNSKLGRICASFPNVHLGPLSKQREHSDRLSSRQQTPQETQNWRLSNEPERCHLH